tara:strand:+ start:203 stop:559 length:357 start_codon:yes stop_codon:yes gene_type:complete
MSQYRKGYIFEKKTNAYVQELLSEFNNLKFYAIESRGSKGTADIIFGLFNKKNGARTWFGLQCKRGYVSLPEKNREIKKSLDDYGMQLFYSTPMKEKKTLIEIYPDLSDWVMNWLDKA